MAINTQKFLPSSKGGALAKVSSKVISTKSTPVFLTEKSVKNIGVIRTKVVEIENILKGTLASEKKALDEKKRKESTKRREKQEEKLETKPKAEKGSIKAPKAPRLGIFDWIKNFIGNIILGYFAVRLIDHLPKITPILKFLGNAADFIIDVGGKLLNGLVTFVDWGYKAYDATRGFLKNLGGENFVKVFDGFNSVLGTLVETAITTAIVLSSQGEGGVLDIGMDMIRDRLLGKGAQAAAQQAAGQATGAAQAGGIGAGAVAGIVAGAGLLASALGEGAFQLRKIATKPIQDAKKAFDREKNPLMKMGRGAVLGGMYTLLGPLSALGVLLDVVGAPFRYAIELLRYPFLSDRDKEKQAYNLAKFDARIREDFRKALNMVTLGFAFKEKGSFGNIYGNQGAQKGMMGKMAGGGRPVTRGGKSAGSVQRIISQKQKGKYKRSVVKKPSKIEIKPGADIGGEDKIFGIFPNPLKAAQKVVDAVNPFKIVKTAGEDLGNTDYFGPILAITSKITLGQKPSKRDYDNVGLGLNMLIAQGVQEKQLKGGLVAAFAEGGLVDPDVLSAAEKGSDISNWVAKTFQGEIESNAQRTLRLIKENAEKEKLQKGPDKSDPTLQIDDYQLPGGMTQGTWGPLLDLIAGKESGGNYEAMYPSTTLKGATKMTIADVAKRATGAVGKYQQLPQYLVGRAKAAGLDVNRDLYSPENQEKIIINVNIKGRGGERWLKGEISDEQFMQGLSQEFASLPNAQGRFYYPGQRSAMTPEKVKAALSKVKKGGYSQQELAGAPGGGNIQLGKGYGGAGSKIAGEVGRFIKQKLRSPAQFQAVTEHPEHGGVRGKHANRSFHYQGRAIDIGAYTHEQGPILNAIAQFNALKGVKPVELLHGKNDPYHTDHVHVAYQKGGATLGYPHLAMLGEKGEEIVVDADSAGPAKDMLLAINQATGYRGVMQAIQQYAPYDELFPQTVVVPTSDSMDPNYDSESGSESGAGVGVIIAANEDPYESLYMGG